ncbi:MAG: inositol monophosphatase [Thermofilaceae archaeon]
MASLLEIVRGAAKAGGLAALRVREEGGLREVGVGRGGDVALAGDLAAERAVLGYIESTLSDFTFISEEVGEVTRGRGGVTFVVDPVDGSRNYKLGIPFFATSVAAAEGSTLDDVVAAAVYAPALGFELYAVKGGGAYLNGRRLAVKRTGDGLVVSVNSTPKAGALPFALMLLLSSKGAVVRNLGAACLELSLVAAGALDAYIDPWYATRLFDLAAATLIVREAGAVVSVKGRLGETPLLSIDERISLVAAVDGETLELVLGALRALGSSALSG